MIRLHIHLERCHGCEPYFAKFQPGGCAGECACLWDGRGVVEHAQTGYCPAGRYPFAGLGSVLGWIFWHLRLPQLLRWLKWYDPQKCACAARQGKLNNITRRLWRRLRGGT